MCIIIIIDCFIGTETCISGAVQEVLCSLSSQQKARWFRDAFAIPRLSWSLILREWRSHLPDSNFVSDEIDGTDHSSDSVEGMEIMVIPDPSSELVQSPELWLTLWRWLPDWVMCKEPECIFRASRDGYK